MKPLAVVIITIITVHQSALGSPPLFAVDLMLCAPSFLMKKMDAETIKTQLQDGHDVQAEMTWSLPAPDDRVEWSLWTSAMDTSAAVQWIFPFFSTFFCFLFS